MELLESFRPREIKAGTLDTPVLVFTDGAHEELAPLTSHGAVLIDPATDTKRFFGESIPSTIVDAWSSTGKRQLVGQAEVLPVLVSKVVWAPLLRGRKVIWFLDNDSAKAALGSGASPVMHTFVMLCISAHLDLALEAVHWYARVPSKANLADDASRLRFDVYGAQYLRTEVDWASPSLLAILDTCTSAPIAPCAADTSTTEL